MRKLGVLVASGVVLGGLVLATPAAMAHDRHEDRRADRREYRQDQDRHERRDYRHDNKRYDRSGRNDDYRYGSDPFTQNRQFSLGVRIVDHEADDRGRRGVSVGDRWSVTFNLVDWRHRVGDGVADCRVTHARNRNWRDSKSYCDIVFRLPDGNLRMAGTIDGDDFDDGHATVPVRGGSGEFQGADGKTVFRPNGTYFRGDRGRSRDLTADVTLR